MNTYVWEPPPHLRVRDPHMHERFGDRKGDLVNEMSWAGSEVKRLGGFKGSLQDDEKSSLQIGQKKSPLIISYG